MLPACPYNVTTAYSDAKKPADRGSRFQIRPMEVMKAISIASNGLKQWVDAGYGNDHFGLWEVVLCQAGGSLTANDLVTEMGEAITCTGGTTTTIVGTVAYSTTDIWKGGMILKDVDTGGTTGEEGKKSLITANSATGVTFTPAWGEAVANNDVVFLWYPFKVVRATTVSPAMGIVLATTTTVGDWVFVLVNGIHLAGGIAADNAAAHGDCLTSGSAGVFAERADYGDPVLGELIGTRSATNGSTTWPMRVRTGK